MELKKIDLSKAEGHRHPDIIVGHKKWYLAKLKWEDGDSEFIVGRFEHQWHGLHFDCEWGACGIQFDAPGTNHSPWVGLWEIVQRKRSKEDAHDSHGPH